MANTTVHVDRMLPRVEARALVERLFNAGVWFNLEPWPDDQYLVTVKREAERFLPTVTE